MNATHTPGPWHFSGLFIKVDRAEIAKVNVDLRDFDGPLPEDIKQQYSNARLIAAAPELLEACESFYHAECEKFASDPFNADSQPDSPVQKAWLLARAAIAKAKGQA